jgi:hypothetical protein
MTVNLIRLDPIPRKGGIKLRRLVAANPISIANACPVWMCGGKGWVRAFALAARPWICFAPRYLDPSACPEHITPDT